MIKEAPSFGRIFAMVAFALSCFGILIFLWLNFGGSMPLQPEGYRVTVSVPEAAQLAQEADVRISGVPVGRVKKLEPNEQTGLTDTEIEIDSRYAPIPRDTRAILRQKTLLGETYLELTPGHRSSGTLDDGGRLANSRVEETVELDEIFSAFDPDTREAFRDWVKELAGAIERGGAENLSDALGNFEGFAVDGAELLTILDEQGLALHRLIRNTGEVFGALNERQGALRELIANSKRTFEATARKVDSERHIEFLVQGTLYPDVVESGGGAGAANIKSHHNVGGLPDDLQFDLVEPLRALFKDEVRAVGAELGLPERLVWRQPFPGPGLAIRIIGEVTEERLEILREADAILQEEVRRAGLYRDLWQSFAVLPAIRSVGVQGDERTYAYPIVIRAVTSEDAMTADWARLPYDLLETIAARMIGELREVNRVVLDITSKPPGTIEWE